MAIGDYLCEFKHLCEVDISFAENTGQRLDKIPRIIGDSWRERGKREKEGGRERKRKGEKERVVQRPSLGFP